MQKSGELEDITVKTNKNKTQEEKRIKQPNTKSISDLWDLIIHVIAEQNWGGQIFEETMCENYQK